MNRSCQRHTQGFETEARRMISAVPQPPAVARMVRARQTSGDLQNLVVLAAL
jgi:hypothetical protein